MKEDKNMTILVDADACPVKEIIIKVAKSKNIPVVMVIDTSHQINDGYSEVIQVDKASDSVDIALINKTKKGDIVVTQDYGVATLALSKSAKTLSQNGLIYTEKNIDTLLFERHIGKKVRKGGGRTASISKRTSQDDERFEKGLLLLLNIDN